MPSCGECDSVAKLTLAEGLAIVTVRAASVL